MKIKGRLLRAIKSCKGISLKPLRFPITSLKYPLFFNSFSKTLSESRRQREIKRRLGVTKGRSLQNPLKSLRRSLALAPSRPLYSLKKPFAFVSSKNPLPSIKKPLIYALTLTLILTLVAIIPNNTPKAQAAWYNSSWNYRQKIIIDHNKVPNTDQTDFPVLIKITDTNNAIFTKAQDDGDDLLFTSSNETTKLSHEIETFSKSTHELWAWVKIPSLSHTTDTVIYLYYGNASATSQQTATDVWSNGYAGVWHAGDATTSTISDSTSGAHAGAKVAVNEPIEATGKIGKGQQFDGSNDYITPTNADWSNLAQNFSISCWVKASSSWGGGWATMMNPGGRGWIYAQGYDWVRFYPPGTTLDSTTGISNTSWTKVTATYDGATASIYMNGVLSNSKSVSGSLSTLGQNTFFGQNGISEYWVKGIMDEFSVGTARSADWIATEYNNQNSPETFAYVSSEVGKDNYTYQSLPSGWYDASWSKRQPVTFDHTKVPNTNQTDFPALIKITDVSNDIWANTQADGDDILFADTSGNKLAHEIEKYDSATHELWAWVKIPSLLTASDTTIYMYYGNSNAPSQQNKTAVWSNGYAGVWHSNDTTTSTIADSTSNAKTGTKYAANNPVEVGGEIGKAQSYDGSNSYIKTSSAVLSDTTTPFAISAWINPASFAPLTGTNRRVLAESFDSNNAFMMILGNAAGTTNTFTFSVYKTGTEYSIVTNNTFSINTWYLISMVWNGSSGVVYVNGSLQATTADPGFWKGTDLNKLYIGARNNSSADGYVNGTIDEIHIDSTARSADWIATEYNNQNSPSTFETFGAAETQDTFAPNNPSTITALYSAGGSPILNNSGTDSTPYYSWPEPEVAGGATDQTGAYVSGVSGYYSYFGTSCGAGGADPASSRGVLSDTGSGLHYSSDVNVSVPDLTTNTGAYCLRIKTKDNAGNISAVSEVATYNFDTTAPNPPTFIASNPAGYSSTDSFDFTWPVATDVGSGASGVGGYQYKRGTGTDDWSATQTATSANDILSYQTGANIFLVRSVDNAGNTSDQVQTTYYYSNSVPTKPTAVTPNPALDDENSFAFSWTAPVHSRPIVDYGYSINAVPTAQNLTWTGSASTTLAADSFATIQGDNTFYIVAKDDSGAYGVDVANYGTATFNCTTVAPPIPNNPTISDSSNRAYSTYSLTIKWSAGLGQDQNSFSHYIVERSTDGETFSNLATTTSTAYIDVSSLSNSTTYYYRIKAVDNADSTSASSSIVSRTPTGKYDSPPTLLQGPSVNNIKATEATITWVSNRASSGSVRFGTDQNNLIRSQIDPTEETEHSITIPGLEGATTYYYQIQSLDNDRDYSSESAYSPTASFTTLSLPAISDVKISNITLNSADLSWTTSTASNASLSYGNSISYGSSWSDEDSYTTNHTYKFQNLDHTSTYHFKITAQDQDGNTLVSDDYVFDTLPRPKISAVNFETNIEDSQPKSYITWTTNVATTSSVDYTPTNGSVTYEESQSSFVTNHKVELSHLSDNTSYSFTVYGSDQFGNKAISDQFTFSTPFDSRAAIISDLSVEPSNVGLSKQDKAQIVVSWRTDEPTTTQVEYGKGLTGSFTNKTSEDKTLVNDHFVIISDLEPSSPYHIRVISKDKGDNITVSEEVSTVPGDVPKSIIQTILQSFQSVFGWIAKLI